jgi:hypothetical protein
MYDFGGLQLVGNQPVLDQLQIHGGWASPPLKNPGKIGLNFLVNFQNKYF